MIEEIGEERRKEWNEFVALLPHSHILQSFEYGEVRKRVPMWDVVRLGLVEGGRLKAAISILKLKIPFAKKCIFYAPRGPAVDFSDRDSFFELMDGVREKAEEEGAIFLKVDPDIEEGEEEGSLLKEYGFSPPATECHPIGAQPKTVFRLSLDKSLEEIMARFHHKTRYNIRKAKKEGVVVKESKDIAAFYKLLVETSRRQRFAIYPFWYYEALYNELVPKSLGRLFLAEVDRKPIAGIFLYIFAKKCWYAYGASSYEHRSLFPSNLLQWEAIVFAKSMECVWYDFRGTGIHNPEREGPESSKYGIYRFKKGFSPDFVRLIPEQDLVFKPLYYKIWNSSVPLLISAKGLYRRWVQR
jgi:lipid II:glycine glycyltransferase (peptidoglycan interpeptide bridge formation enzyme)